MAKATGPRRATLQDVADAAGVSISTASKALNGRQYVSASTRDHVQRIAVDLQFSPNLSARSLSKGRTGTVGLITNDLEGRFSIPVLMGAEDAFGAGNASVFLCDARGDAIREQHHLRALLSRRVDGLIVVGDQTNPRASIGREIPVPVVYAYAPSIDPADISVIADNVRAGRMAAEHMLMIDRRRIAYVSGARSSTAAQDRVQGAREALESAGVTFLSGSPMFGEWNELWGRAATRLILAQHPDVDAILVASDEIARGVLDALRDVGREIPADVAVLAHENQVKVASQARPPLTSIDMNLHEVGERAAQLLLGAISGKPERGVHAVGCDLVLRSSTISE